MKAVIRPTVIVAAILFSASAGLAKDRTTDENHRPKDFFVSSTEGQTAASPAQAAPMAETVVSVSPRGSKMWRSHGGRWSRRLGRSRLAAEMPSPRRVSEPRLDPAPTSPSLSAGVSVVEKSVEGPPVKASAEGPREQGSPTLADLIAKHAHENGVPVELARAVVRVESRGNARASNRGALGLMQIKPGTARSVGFSGGASGLFSPEVNLHFGMRVLGAAYKAAGGDFCRTLARYQSGARTTRLSRANLAYCSRARAATAGL